MDKTTPTIEPGSAGHLHLCSPKDHYWQHAGPTAEGCALPTFIPYIGLLSAAECAVCAGRDDLLTRPPHAHRCGFCEVEWIHEGRCADGLAAWCPWDFTRPSGETAPGTRTGRHRHHCPNCGTHWSHLDPCAAQWQVALPACPTCGATPQRRTGRGRLGARPASRRGVLVGAALGIAAITLMTFHFLPGNPGGGRVTAPPPRVAVAPTRPPTEPAPSPPPQISLAPPSEARSSVPAESQPPEDIAARGRPDERETRARDRWRPIPGIAGRDEPGAPELGPSPPASPRATGVPVPPPPVASAPPAAAPAAPDGRTPEPAADAPRAPSLVAARPLPPAPLPPAVPSPPERLIGTPGPGGPPLAVPERDLASPASPPVASPPSARRPGPEPPSDRVPEPTSGTRGASGPAGTVPAPGSAAGPGPGGSPPVPVQDLSAPPAASPVAAVPIPSERPAPPVAAIPAPPLASAPGANIPPSGDPRASAPSNASVPFARGAPLTGAAGGGTALDTRWTLEALARHVPAPASLPPSTTPREARTLDVAGRGVVRVTAFQELAGGAVDDGRPGRSGYGFVVTEDGILLTAGRLVAGATRLTVLLPDGRTLPVTSLSLDPLSDLAVLHVRGGRLQPIPLGSSGRLSVGDPLIALGGAGVSEAAVTVRATGTATGGDLVTDARPTGQARVGLPLLNVRGEAVGVVTHTRQAGPGAPLDFAVPIDRAKPLLRGLGTAARAAGRDLFSNVPSDR
jgi:S1-C subfamily serine protease